MSVHRVYLPGAAEGIEHELPADEAAHLTRVLRLGPGDTVQVFDGEGAAFEAEIAGVTRSTVHVRVGAPAPSAVESPVRLIVAPALIKGDGFDEIVRDAVMMGAAAVRPLLAARTVVKPRAAMHERWQRVALAAAKQSGRAVLPAIDPPASLDQIVASDASAARLVCVEPSADVMVTDVLTMPAPSSALVLLGPEGGWAPDELEFFKEKALTCIRLGARTITAERATLAALAVLAAAWERS